MPFQQFGCTGMFVKQFLENVLFPKEWCNLELRKQHDTKPSISRLSSPLLPKYRLTTTYVIVQSCCSSVSIQQRNKARQTLIFSLTNSQPQLLQTANSRCFLSRQTTHRMSPLCRRQRTWDEICIPWSFLKQNDHVRCHEMGGDHNQWTSSCGLRMLT